MATLASDDFNRADANPISGNWTAPTFTGGATNAGWHITSNAAVPNDLSSNDSWIRNTAVTWPGDQWAQAALTINGTNAGGSGVGVAVRIGTGTQCYRIVVDHGSTNNWSLQKFSDPTGTGPFNLTFLVSTTRTFVDGDTVYLEVQGSTLQVRHNGTLVSALTITDSTPLTGGSPGLSFSTAEVSASVDNWSGGDFQTTGTVAITLQKPVVAASGSAGSVPVNGPVAVTLQRPTVAIAANVPNSGTVAITLQRPVFAASGSAGAPNHYYTTTFPLTENPISQGSNWINGQLNGVDWSNSRTTPGRMFGTQDGGPTSGGPLYNDSITVLRGTWTADQKAQGVVYNDLACPSNGWPEVELLLRFSITANNAHGYEILFSTSDNNGGGGYCAIVRWNGPRGNQTIGWDPITSGGDQHPGSVHVGDIVSATIVGNTINAYIQRVGQPNPVLVATATDTTWTTGAPGAAFNYWQDPGQINAAASPTFGYTQLTAWSLTVTGTSAPTLQKPVVAVSAIQGTGGPLAVTLQKPTVAAAGNVAVAGVSGPLATTLQTPVVVVAGSVSASTAVTGTITIVLNKLQVAISGAVANPFVAPFRSRTMAALQVEVAFANNPLAANPTWINVTDRIREVAIRRGRDNELGRYQAGTATLVVDNRDRRFDPVNDSGPYYPNVVPGRRLRVRAGANIVPNPSFQASTVGWQVQGVASITRVNQLGPDGSDFIGSALLSGPADWVGYFSVPVQPSTTYTGSIYFRGDGGSVHIRWWSNVAGEQQVTGGDNIPILGSFTWQRFGFTRTTGVGETTAGILIRSTIPQVVGLDAFQFEPGAIGTMYTDGIETLFDGFVEAWPQAWSPPREANVHITATDGFKLLNLRQIPGGYAPVVRSDNPVGYWRLGDTAAAPPTAFDSSVNGFSGTYTGGFTLNQPGALVSDPDRAVLLNGTTGYVQIADRTTLRFTTNLTIEAWVNPTAVFQNTIVCKGNTAGDPDYIFAIGFTTAGTLAFWNGTSWVSTVGGLVTTGVWQHLAVTFDGTTIRFYRNGVEVSAPPSSTVVQTSTDPLRIGVQATVGFYNGLIDEVAVYSTALSAARIAAHYQAGSGVYPVQVSSARISAVLNATGWPLSERLITGGTETMQAAVLTSTTALAHLQQVGETEAGRFFMNADGKVRFDGRDTFFLPPNTTTLATFGDNPLDQTERSYVNLVATYDDSQIWNDVRVTREGGIEQQAADTTSQERYGTRTMSKQGMLQTTDASALSLAQYLRNQYKDPQLRFVTLAIRPGVRPELWREVLARDIGDRIRVGRRPQGLPPAIAQDNWIEGVEHDIHPDSWETRWTLSRADTQTFWVLGDATAGVLGTTTVLSF